MVLLGILVLLYLGSYFVLSRRGYDESRQYHMEGFYYFSPENTDTWRRLNYGCVYFFAPLNFIDRCLGSGMAPAAEPLWDISR
jgi:hypothetical protein